MHCPVCHSENIGEAVTCSTCGRSLRADSDSPGTVSPVQPGRRSGSRRRNANSGDGDAATESNNPAAWRAYRVSLWSLVPGLGLFLAPIAVLLGCLAARGAGEDASARNRAKAAVLFGTLIALTQWLGVALMIYGWKQ